MNNKILKQQIKRTFEKKVEKDANLKNVYMGVYNKKHDFKALFAKGKEVEHPNQPNYMASVGKLFTSVLIGRLYEKKSNLL